MLHMCVVLQIKGFLAANLQTIHEKQNSNGKEGGNLYISFELAARKGARAQTLTYRALEIYAL